MSCIEFNGRSLATDEEGYLENMEEWTPEVAELMATMEGCDLSENHWEVITFLREYYTEYEIAPAIRVLTKAIGTKLGREKGSTQYLYELYPLGPARQACKYAGLPKPTGCI